MKKSVKKLLEDNSPTSLFLEVKSKLYEKVADKLDSISETVAPTVFQESEELISEENGYIGFYNGRKVEVHASTSYEAHKKVAEMLRVPSKQRHMISVKLAEKDGKKVTHSTLFAEEVEQIDELSRSTLGSYIKKAIVDKDNTEDSRRRSIAHFAKTGGGNIDASKEYTGKRIAKRKSGIDTAINKLVNKSETKKQKFTKEELELSEKQNLNMLGRYRLVDKNGNVVHSHDDKDAVIRKGKELGGFPHVRMIDSDKRLNEEEINEISKQLLGNYIKKANMDSRLNSILGHTKSRELDDLARNTSIPSDIKKHVAMKTGDEIVGHTRKLINRKNGIAKAVDRLTNEEQETINEVSKKLLGNYVKTAQHDVASKAYHLGKKIVKTGALDRKTPDDSINKEDRKIVSRQNNIKKAVDRLTNEDMGAHTISTTHGGKNGKTFATFVVNKKRVSKADQRKRFADLIKKHTPKSTVFDKFVAANEEQENEDRD